MMNPKFTIMGATGFIGRNFAKHLQEKNYDVFIAPRDIKQLAGQQLGHVVYIMGLTGGNARQRPHEAVEVHVTLLSWLLQSCKFESLLYCSSTRIYSAMNPNVPVSEKEPITIMPDASNLFDMSKLMGEVLCQRMENPKVRIARLSNVYGADQSKSTFLGAVLDEVKQTRALTINDQPESVKDYVAVQDVCELLEQIALHGKEHLYNVASGRNVKAQEIGDWVEKAGFPVTFSMKNNLLLFPQIDISRVVSEFGYKPRELKNDFQFLLEQ